MANLKVKWWVEDDSVHRPKEYILEIDDMEFEDDMTEQDKQNVIEGAVKDKFEQTCWPEWEVIK